MYLKTFSDKISESINMYYVNILLVINPHSFNKYSIYKYIVPGCDILKQQQQQQQKNNLQQNVLWYIFKHLFIFIRNPFKV